MITKTENRTCAGSASEVAASRRSDVCCPGRRLADRPTAAAARRLRGPRFPLCVASSCPERAVVEFCGSSATHPTFLSTPVSSPPEDRPSR